VVGNGQVAKNPDQITYTYGTIVTLTATADLGWTFDSWSGDLSGSMNPTTITMDGNKAVTVTFTQNQYTLTTDIVGSGSVTKSPDQPTYTYNTIVTLTAVPEAGWLFSQWSGDLTGSTNPTTITMTGNKAVTATFIRLLVDSEFSDSADNTTLRTDTPGVQDWCESRVESPEAQALLYLDESDVGGNTGKKAGFTASSTLNAYLTQEFAVPQTGTFSVQWDIYIDSISDIAYDRAGWMLIGDNTNPTRTGPNSDDNERFVYMAFLKPGGGTSGTMDLVARDRDDAWGTFTTIASGLNLKQWYTIKVICNLDTDTYDVYVDGVLKKAGVTSRFAKTSVTHISFAQWNDGAGAFYVDNVFSPAVDRYKLTVNTVGSGSVIKTPGESTYAPGAEVTLTATPESGWTFTGWSGDFSGSDNPATITMDSNKVITATFSQIQYTLTVDIVGSGSVTKSPDKTGYSQGETVTLIAVPSAGWSFDSWSGDLTGSTNPTTIEMTGNKVVTATFTEDEYTLTIEIVGSGSVSKDPNQATYTYGASVQLTATADVGWSFSEWTGDLTGSENPVIITMDGDKSITAVFTQDQYTLTINVVGSGSVEKNPDRETYVYGESVTLTAATDTGWTFAGWSGDITSNDNPLDITMDGSKSITATFTQHQYTLTISVEGHGSVTKVPDQATYTYGSSVELTANADPGWTFSHWSGALTGSDNPATLLITGDTTVTAHFTQNQYTLSITVDGSGSVTKNPDQPTYTYGTVVELTATAEAGWTFSHWSGDASGTINPTTVTIDGDKSVTAVFTQNQYTLTINIIGSGSVTKAPDHAVYAHGETVTLTATPETGWSFYGWSGDLTGSQSPIDIIMDSSKSITATFTQDQYILTINIEGEGTVTITPEQTSYTYGTPIQLTANPNAGWTFSHWSGDLSSSDNPINFLITGDMTVTANFTQNQYTLTILTEGGGSVTKAPNKATYVYGDSVELTAVPEIGWSFSYWSGDLSGSTNPITIIIDGNKSVTARFTPEQYTLTIEIVGSGSVSKDPNQATYTYGASVQLTATADVGWSFSGWSGDLTGSDNPATITITGNTEITATFTQDQYTLTLNVVGQGSVNKNPDQATYTYGTEVQLTATPNSGWKFFGWSGDLSGSTNPATITMDRSKSVTATFLQILLVDSNFDNSIDDADLRANGEGQDWYESRNDDPTLLTLDTSDVGGNTGKKVALKNYGIAKNAYLTQEFSSSQTGIFSVSFDIYIDRIQDNGAYDRTGLVYIGDNSIAQTPTDTPCGTSNERFVFMAFYDSTPGDTGNDIQIRVRTSSSQTYGTTSTWTLVASGLSYDTWYTVRLVVNVATGTYDVYVDGVLKGTFSKYNGFTSSSVTHISFSADSDGRGNFYVDNVFAPAELANENLFTLIVLPDTQYYSQSYPAIFANQTQWIVNNVAKMNILFVLHEGDLVQNSDNITQWINANTAMSLLDGNVPWAVLPGNHDGTNVGSLGEDLTNYNTYFSYSRFNGETWYGGAYNNINTNSFTLFSSGEDDYIVFCFQYHPSDAVLAWANNTLAAYSDRRAIIVTHDYLNLDGTRTTEGNHIWNNFIVHHADQIFLVLCGHMHGEARREDPVNGHVVYQILADYQERTNGGDGWLRILEFHPAEDKIYVKTFSPYLNSHETDADSQFILGYDMTASALSKETLGDHTAIDDTYNVLPSATNILLLALCVPISRKLKRKRN
jgi:uncharacterized repeat protein (TIGR02543 family)